MIPTQALNSITLDDMRIWMTQHGVDIDDVTEAVIRIDRRERARISAWLEVSYYLRDVDGTRFHDETGENAAMGTAHIPLQSWPTLTPG